jgi:hypothetical protein
MCAPLPLSVHGGEGGDGRGAVILDFLVKPIPRPDLLLGDGREKSMS